MRVVVVDPYYSSVLADFYRSEPGLERAPYDEQRRRLMALSFGTGDAYSNGLQRLSHVACEVVPNARPLQQAWAREHAPRLARMPWRVAAPRILRAQADQLEADVVYIQSIGSFTTRTLERLRRGRLLAGQIATEAPADAAVRRYDVLFTSFPHYVDRFRRLGVPTELLRIAFDERVLERLGDVRPCEAVFVGQLAPTQHEAANAVLEDAARVVPFEVWGPGVETLPPDSALRRLHRGTAWGLTMYRLLAGARISLNRHGHVSEGHANNMRLFEATGVGSLLLTDERFDLDELFAPGREVATYADAADLVAKLRWYLEHEDERAEIAAAGQARTLRDHTYTIRMRELSELLERYRGSAVSGG